jgi:hypothetical protein
MDLDEQERIKQIVEANGGPDGIVAILGSPDAESAEMFAETISLAIQRTPGPWLESR